MAASGSADPLAAPFDIVGRLPVPIVAEGLGFTYAGSEAPALTGIDFRVEAAGVLLVVGPSGSGKSTLARAIAGIIPREIPGTWVGSLRVADVEVSSAPPGVVAGHVGILFQDPGSQLVMERAGDDVAFGLENRAWPLGAMRERVPDALAQAGLGGFAARRGTTLSGGEQQRLALAGVVAPMPGVLIFDEPTANLDPDGTADFFDRLAAIRAARSATIVLVEHRADRAWPLADQVLALDSEGRMIDLGAPEAVVARSGDVLARAGVWLPGNSSSAPVVAPLSESGSGSVPGPALVEVRELRHEYARGLPSIRDIDLTIGQGERVALVGPNGSGKSTLLRLLAGLFRPAHGMVLIAGKDPARLTTRRLAEQVGFVFQDPELGFVGATVEEEVMTGLAPGRQPEARVLMERLGLPLEAFSGRSPYRLSGGEQRRLSVATALVRGPRLLLLDEPTFGQDRTGWEAMAGILRELVAAGVTVIAATHDEQFATQFATRRVTLADGWVVADDGPEAPGTNQPEPTC